MPGFFSLGGHLSGSVEVHDRRPLSRGRDTARAIMIRPLLAGGFHKYRPISY